MNGAYTHDEEKEEVWAYMTERKIEAMILVEGTDAITGGVVQARHSYTAVSDDIVWDHWFVDCVSEEADGGKMIDLNRFHDTIRANTETPHPF